MSRILTASKLFSQSLHNHGENRCYFCGTDCDNTYLSELYIKDTFTNRDIIARPSSKYVCRGCVMTLGFGEDDELVMIDGSIKKRENQRGLSPHLYSWIITKDKRIPFTKAHISIIRGILTNTNPIMQLTTPFVIVLSDSGQKHLIFRAPVSKSDEVYPIMLEDEIIITEPISIKERIDITTPIVAATGKPALKDITLQTYISYRKYHGNTYKLEEWESIKNDPISKLAVWLSLNKEEATNEYPVH